MASSLAWSVLCVVALMGVVQATMRREFPSDPISKAYRKGSGLVSGDLHFQYKTDFFDVPIDNFAYTSNTTYRMRFIYNNTYYKPGGPIFFYTGNEADVTGYVDNTGIMYDLAPRFNAAIVFAEHRFYGKSLPFGINSYKQVKYLGFLASTQALADYAKFIPYFKSKILKCPENTPVIAFGGSYGGMLSAWMRIKYPHVITGAWAASAPVLYFKGANVAPGAFDKVVTEDFVQAKCYRDVIAKGWDAIKNLAKTPKGRDFLNKQFSIEKKSELVKPEDAEFLIYFVREAFEYMAMVDYPYPTGFLVPLPGWPINKACKVANKKYPQAPSKDEDLVKYMYEISNVYYNSTGTSKSNCVNNVVCGDPATSDTSDSSFGWPWQACTELVMMMCAEGGTNDFFFDECKANGGVQNMVTNFCIKTFDRIGYTKSLMFVDDAPIEYGLNFAAASNIIFTNGKLDPWAVGGVFDTTPGIEHAKKHGVYIFMIEGGAHHLDLRQPNTCDQSPVKNARFQIVNILDCWVHPGKCATLPEAKPLPALDPPTAENCQDVIYGYPWGQK